MLVLLAAAAATGECQLCRMLVLLLLLTAAVAVNDLTPVVAQLLLPTLLIHNLQYNSRACVTAAAAAVTGDRVTKVTSSQTCYYNCLFRPQVICRG